jgi:hypothetical protein
MACAVVTLLHFSIYITNQTAALHHHYLVLKPGRHYHCCFSGAVDNLVSSLTGILPKNVVNKNVWPNFVSRMSKVLVIDDEDQAENQHQLSMPWS